jgi:hypothetical protein
MKRSSVSVILALAVLPALVPVGGHAQWSFDPRVVTMYDDNLANNAAHLTDWSTTLLLTPGYALGGDAWDLRLAYDGAYKFYHSLTELSNQVHAGTLAGRFYWGEEHEQSLDLDLAIGRGVFRKDYAFYDHSLASASGQLKQFLTTTVIQTAGYQLRSVDFDDVEDLSYVEQSLSVGLRWAVAGGTTLIAQADLGAKYYRLPLVVDTLGRRGASSTLFAPDVAQWTGMLRIGQSLAEGSGLSVMAKYQGNARKQSRFLASTTGDISDDELFDDHYGYEGFHGNVMLTQVVSTSILLRLTAGQQTRQYSSLAAYDIDGLRVANQRVDQRRYTSLFLQKTFEQGYVFRAAVDLIRNVSNDEYYDYGNTAITVELAIPF